MSDWPIVLKWRDEPDEVLEQEAKNFEHYRKTGKFSDGQIQIEPSGLCFKIHKFYVAAASEYLEDALTNADVLTVETTLIDEENMNLLLDWIYDGRVLVSDLNKLLGLYGAAVQFRIDLQEDCLEHLSAKLSTNNVFTMWFYANKLPDRKLWDLCCKYVAIHLSELMRSSQALVMELSPESLKSVLAHDQLGFSNEEQTWKVIEQWIEYELFNQYNV